MMALSTREMHSLVGRTQNDNRPLGPTSSHAYQLHRRVDPLRIDYPNLRTWLDPNGPVLWAEMRHGERACYTPELMTDMRGFQRGLKDAYAGLSQAEMPFRYLAWSSAAPKVWSLGGDLTNFTAMIRSRDEAGLRAYAHQAIDILHDNHNSLDLPVLTVAVIEGDAIGGGFEAMLTDDIVIAERGTRFGLPEILFNLFPGMGAYSFLKRKVGPDRAKRLIEDGITREADEMKELGLVDIVCEKGEARTALQRFVAENEGRFATLLTLKRVRQRVDPITRRELIDIVDMWTDLAMQLGEADLKRMDCLARVQQKRRVLG